MKKMLLFVVAMFTAATVSAQFEMNTPDWTKMISDAVETPADVQVYAPIVITNQGDVIKTGTFTQEFEFAGTTLVPIATSSYIVKYDAKGNEVWANALRGAATVTAITADEEGNIYVAGRFADKVIITSTDGSTAEIDGMEANTEQVSSFIVVYDKDGKMLARRQFVPEKDAALEATYMYFPENGDVYFRINNIKVANGKVYVTANYTGVNTIDKVVLEGRVLDVFGFMYMDINSVAALSFEKDLTEAQLVANVQTTEAIVDSQMGLHDINLAVDGENVFVAWTGMGDLSMKNEKETKDFTFEAGSHPFVVANATNGQTKTFEVPAVDTEANFYTIKGMKVLGEQLFLAGTYIGKLPFDKEKTSTGACDAFLAALNTADLSVAWAATSGIDEGDATKYNEIVNGLEIDGSFAGMLLDVIDMGTKEVVETHMFITSVAGEAVTDMKLPLPISALSTSVAGLAANSNMGTMSTLMYFADEDFVQSIDNLETDQKLGMQKMYDLSGRRVAADRLQKGIYISNGQKFVISR